MPDRDYYLDETEKGREIQQAYRDYMAMMLEAGGYENVTETAQGIYQLEEKMARDVIWARTVRRNRDLTYNALTQEELVALSGDVPVAAMLSKIGLDA